MGSMSAIDEKTGRKFYLDDPDDLEPGEEVVFILSLHGGGSVGAWQRLYFPAFDYKEKYRLVIATPSAATKEPARRWVGEADDEHLRNIVDYVLEKYGRENVRSFWLVGHSQGGMTSNRLLREDPFFGRACGRLAEPRAGVIGPVELPASFFVPVWGPMPAGTAGRWRAAPGGRSRSPSATSRSSSRRASTRWALPEASPWAEKYGAGPRVRPLMSWTTSRGDRSTTRCGGEVHAGVGTAAPARTAQVYVCPSGARDGRVIADVVRLVKGHTEGLSRASRRRSSDDGGRPGGKARSLGTERSAGRLPSAEADGRAAGR